ncbi:(2Fe-2S)-binding protein [Pelagibius litoralis]|uniref:(2Fe-2S)-binding protein n=2 Tax=Pelagibius litoralis TaxID=374515 RepID=A0A967KF54_9PROT|nr:(2Fe-2S)-binding protein [Pelagibius litoralis]
MGLAGHSQGQLRRVAATDRPRIAFTLDGALLEALEGDTILTAILTNSRYLRRFEFNGEPRAGFCLMGACQDCWVRQSDGMALRACTTLIESGMTLLTRGADGG